MDSNCPNQTLLSDYVAGRLALKAHETIDEHLDSCPNCQATIETIDEQLDTSLSQLLKVEPNSETEDETADVQLDELILRAKELEPGHTIEQRSKSNALMPGTLLGNYELIELIGVGGMGDVYRARHLKMNREVALKLISDQRLSSPEARGRFQREVESAAKLSHPNIVAAYDADGVDGKHFLAMEYVDAQNLAEIVDSDGPLPFELVVEIILQSANGLAYAHTQGIVHRDVKPANLLLDLAGNVKVLDMGLASAPIGLDQDSDSNLTTSQSLMGTAAFMAPEQAADPRAVDQRADIYSLGCTAYYLLTGKTIFQGTSIMDMIFQHRDTPPPKLSDHCPECTPQFESVFQRMVAKSPDDRFASFEEVIAQLSGKTTTSQPTPANVPKPAMSSNKVIALVTVTAIMIGLIFWWPSLFKKSDDVAIDQKPDSSNPVNNKPLNDNDPSSLIPRTPTDPVSISMVEIKPGKFLMGAHPENKNGVASAKPRHPVTLTKPFELGKFEITKGEFDAVMNKTPLDKSKERSNLPVSGVSWIEAIKFCNKLSEKNGLKPYYKIGGQNNPSQVTVAGGNGFRLPTEAEWEYASRGGSDTIWDFGNDPAALEEFAWFANNAIGEPQAVGTKKPNRFGLHDMYGNVPEWCWDRFNIEYYAQSAPINPTGATTGISRVFRGGGAQDSFASVNSSYRTALAVHYGRLNEVGIRVARNLD